jgi:hypothetical protein
MTDQPPTTGEPSRWKRICVGFLSAGSAFFTVLWLVVFGFMIHQVMGQGYERGKWVYQAVFLTGPPVLFCTVTAFLLVGPRRCKLAWISALVYLLPYLFTLCLAISHGSRDLREYDLDEQSFQADTLAKIQKESVMVLPEGAKGLRFHYVPPIDPIFFARIAIPSNAEKIMAQRIEGLPASPPFPHDFANQRCAWWPTDPKGVILSRQAFQNGWHLEIHLVREKEQLIFYLKYFTI